MRKSILSIALLALCGVSQARAQTQLSFSNQVSPTPAPRLVAAQSGDNLLDFGSSPGTENSGVAALTENPFDFLEGSASTPRSQRATSSSSAQSNGSHPVSSMSSGQNVIESIVNHARVSQIPNVSAAPVNWAQRCPRQPIADFMMREDCVAGLWDGYEAQRAAECAAKWDRIAGHHKGCGGCGGCNSCAAPACGTGCSTGACGGVAINRYTNQTHFHAEAGCDSHPQPMVGCASCGIHASPISGPIAIPTPQTSSRAMAAPVASPTSTWSPAPAATNEANGVSESAQLPNVAFGTSPSLSRPLIR